MRSLQIDADTLCPDPPRRLTRRALALAAAAAGALGALALAGPGTAQAAFALVEEGAGSDPDVVRIAGSSRDDVLSVQKGGGWTFLIRDDTEGVAMVPGPGCHDAGTDGDAVNCTPEDSSVEGAEVRLRGGDDAFFFHSPDAEPAIPTEIRGGPGDDLIYGGRGDSELVGGPGNDILGGHAPCCTDPLEGGDDRLQGGRGHDLLTPGEGRNAVLGGAGRDAISFTGPTPFDVGYPNPGAAEVPPVEVDMETEGFISGGLARGEGTATLFKGVEDVIGSPGDDVIEGDAGPNVIDGYRGDDVIRGLGGNDRLDGGRGDDLLRGNGGDDLLNDGSVLMQTLDLRSTHELPTLAEVGEPGFAFGNRGEDRMLGGPGNDLIVGGQDSDDLRGGTGHDVLRGARGRDRLRGAAGADDLLGGGHSDILSGNRGRDRLKGQDGRDRMHGNRGPDLLFAREGNRDLVDGGPGTNDRARFDRLDLLRDVEGRL